MDNFQPTSELCEQIKKLGESLTAEQRQKLGYIITEHSTQAVLWALRNTRQQYNEVLAMNTATLLR